MNDDPVYLSGRWAPIGCTVPVGAFTYVSILLPLRLTGSRTLSRLRAFDFIAAVAVGAASPHGRTCQPYKRPSPWCCTSTASRERATSRE